MLNFLEQLYLDSLEEEEVYKELVYLLYSLVH